MLSRGDALAAPASKYEAGGQASQLALLFIVALALAPLPAAACADFAKAPTKRWSTTRDSGINWLVTPCGDRFFSTGVNVIDAGASYRTTTNHYHWSHTDPSVEAWAVRNHARLTGWGFNTAGGWSLPAEKLDLPFIPNLELGRNSRFHWFDPFAPETETRMRAMAEKSVRPYRGDARRIGYFVDNEVGWWRGALFSFYIQEPARSVSKQRLVDTLHKHYRGDFARLAADYVLPAHVASFADLLHSEGHPIRLRAGGRGIDGVRLWTREVTALYYRMTSAALREADPDALVFGDRLPIYYDPDAVASMAGAVDAVATNYNVDAPDGWLAHYFFDGLSEITGNKPVLISEWFYAARENRSGNRNNGHLMTVGTQAERAAGAGAAARRFAQLPDLVGYHWFQFHDHPPGGRSDGEDYNFGLVDIRDQPYDGLIASLGASNRAAPALHADPGPKPKRTRAALPQAEIRLGDGVLTEWPKDAALLPPMVPQAGEVAFGETYAAWNPAGLALAFIGMDYYDLDLLAYGAEYPRGEAFHLEIGVDAGGGPRRFRLNILPPRDGLSGGSQRMRAEFCLADAACTPVEGAAAHYFGSDQPRITFEAQIPWAALGVAGPPASSLRLDLAATAWYRSRWMSLSGRAPDATMADPSKWQVFALVGR
jgi:hypothetical protein